jgi:hypothetical protein
MQFWHIEMANRTVGCHLFLSVQSLLCSDTVVVPICSEMGNSIFCVLEGDMHASGIANAGPFRTNARQS